MSDGAPRQAAAPEPMSHRRRRPRGFWVEYAIVIHRRGYERDARGTPIMGTLDAALRDRVCWRRYIEARNVTSAVAIARERIHEELAARGETLIKTAETCEEIRVRRLATLRPPRRPSFRPEYK